MEPVLTMYIHGRMYSPDRFALMSAARIGGSVTLILIAGGVARPNVTYDDLKHRCPIPLVR